MWTAGTANAGASAVLGDDGNFVVYDDNGDELVSTGSWGFPDAAFAITSAGMTVVADDGGSKPWTNAQGPLLPPTVTTPVADAPTR